MDELDVRKRVREHYGGETEGCCGEAEGGGCGADLGVGPGAYNWELYQPADRYWLFQGIETGLYVVLAALLIYLAVRRVRRLA